MKTETTHIMRKIEELKMRKKLNEDSLEALEIVKKKK